MALLKRQTDTIITGSTSLTDQVSQVLISEVTSGQYEVGEVLPSEKVIAQRLGVSRTILRESLARLRVEGLLESKPGRGLAVIATSLPAVLRIHAAHEDIEQITSIVELRRGFEIEAASLAAARRNESDLYELEAALDEMAAAILSSDIEAGVTADWRFHYGIAQA